jgi:hypothetical protein
VIKKENIEAVQLFAILKLMRSGEVEADSHFTNGEEEVKGSKVCSEWNGNKENPEDENKPGRDCVEGLERQK